MLQSKSIFHINSRAQHQNHHKHALQRKTKQPTTKTSPLHTKHKTPENPYPKPAVQPENTVARKRFPGYLKAGITLSANSLTSPMSPDPRLGNWRTSSEMPRS